jgi:hypothetical protein
VKDLVLLGLILCTITGVAALVCGVVGAGVNQVEMLTAGGVSVVATILGLVPAVVVRRCSEVVVCQAGLAGSMAQLVLTLGLAGLAWIVGLVGDKGFLFWLLGFYLVSLIGATAVLIHLIGGAIEESARPGHD